MIGDAKNVRVEMEMKKESDGKVDTPGILHWERQPRFGTPHPRELHEKLEGEKDVLNHMHKFHFAENSPVDIKWREEDKVDLLAKIEGISEASPTISRENGLEPGKYQTEVIVTTDNAGKKSKKFLLSIGKDIEDMEVLSS